MIFDRFDAFGMHVVVCAGALRPGQAPERRFLSQWSFENNTHSTGLEESSAKKRGWQCFVWKFVQVGADNDNSWLDG